MAEIGATLREARMRARIDIGEVETRTKIRAKYLRALENEEWDLLPGPVYVKSFLRTYGDFLGLDSRLLVDEYRRQFERPSDHELQPISSLTRERERERGQRGPLISSWMVIALVLVAVVVVLFLVGSLTGKKTHTTTSTHAGKAHRRRHRAAAAAPAKPKTVKVQMIPTGAIYVCLVNSAGRKLIDQQTFSSGQTVPVESGSKLLLTLGNNSLQLKVNGRTVPVTASSSAIRLQIDPNGVHPIPMSTTPTCP